MATIDDFGKLDFPHMLRSEVKPHGKRVFDGVATNGALMQDDGVRAFNQHGCLGAVDGYVLGNFAKVGGKRCLVG